jgi:tRNA modification GTPase
VLWLQDATAADAAMPDEPLPEGVPLTVVRNKIDLCGEAPGIEAGGPPVLRLSAKTGAGIEVLRRHLRDLAGYRDLGEGAYTARRRHIDALRRAAAHFVAGRDALSRDRAGELLAEELRLAQDALGEITGKTAPDDLLGRIFADFCIGK